MIFIMKFSGSREMIIFAAVIWLLTALGRWWNKWIEVHRARASLITWAILFVGSWLYLYITKVPLDIKQFRGNFWYILIPALSIVIVRPLVIVGFQKWFSVSSFPLLFSVFAMVFTVLLWILFFKEVISLKQCMWIILAIIATFLLK